MLLPSRADLDTRASHCIFQAAGAMPDVEKALSSVVLLVVPQAADPDNSLFLISRAMVTRRSGRELLADRYAGFSSLHVGPND